MSIADSVRRALRNAAAPLCAKDLRELCGEDITSQQISTALNALEASDEVEIDRDARPFTYVRTQKLAPTAREPEGGGKSPTAFLDAASDFADASRDALMAAAKAPASVEITGPAPGTALPPLPASAYTPGATPLVEYVAGELSARSQDAASVARRAATIMLEEFPHAELSPRVRAFVIEALREAA